MGNIFKRAASNIGNEGDGGAGRAGDVQKQQQENKPKPPPPTIFYNPQQRKQRAADAYDSTMGQSRFQSTAPRHF